MGGAYPEAVPGEGYERRRALPPLLSFNCLLPACLSPLLVMLRPRCAQQQRLTQILPSTRCRADEYERGAGYSGAAGMGGAGLAAASPGIAVASAGEGVSDGIGSVFVGGRSRSRVGWRAAAAGCLTARPQLPPLVLLLFPSQAVCSQEYFTKARFGGSEGIKREGETEGQRRLALMSSPPADAPLARRPPLFSPNTGGRPPRDEG